MIIWDWPDKYELQQKAKENIIFLWKIENKKTLAKIVSQSRWLINLTKESFWLATAEALAMWVPVFAYGESGSLELLSQTIKNEITDWKYNLRQLKKQSQTIQIMLLNC